MVRQFLRGSGGLVARRPPRPSRSLPPHASHRGKEKKLRGFTLRAPPSRLNHSLFRLLIPKTGDCHSDSEFVEKSERSEILPVARSRFSQCPCGKRGQGGGVGEGFGLRNFENPTPTKLVQGLSLEIFPSF